MSGTNYYHDVPWAVGGYAKLTGNAPIEDFFFHALTGKLPAFSLIDPQFFGGGANDDHPDHDVRLGQALIPPDAVMPDAPSIVIFAVVLAVMLWKNQHPASLMLGAALAGIGFSLF